MMTLKRKKRLIKTILGFSYVIAVALPFINWNIKNKIVNNFAQIEFSIYKAIPDRKDGNFDLYLSYCDTVIQFVNNNPIELDFNINCKDDIFETDKLLAQESRNVFIKQVQRIYNQYRRSERRANYLFFSILIIAPILLAFIRNYINKRFQEKNGLLKSEND